MIGWARTAEAFTVRESQGSMVIEHFVVLAMGHAKDEQGRTLLVSVDLFEQSANEWKVGRRFFRLV